MENEKRLDDKKPLLEEEEIFRFLRHIVSKRKTIFVWTAVFATLGVIVLLTQNKEYTATVSMAPETGQGSISGGLSSLASMAGVDISSMSGTDDAIYPYLYPDIVQSMSFLTSLLDARIRTVDSSDEMTYLYYRQNIQKKNIVKTVIGAPKKWIKSLMSMFVRKAPWDGSDDVFDAYNLSEKQYNFMESFKKDVSIDVDKKTDVITLSFTAQDPKVAALMVDFMRGRLQEVITDYRTHKAQVDYSYYTELYLDAKRQYEEAQLKYAEFCDRNHNMNLERVMIERDRLETERDLKSTLFSQWAQQLELSKAKIQQNTPAYTVLVPASIPVLPSTPRKIVVLIAFCVLGFLFGLSLAVFRDPVVRIHRKIFSISE